MCCCLELRRRLENGRRMGKVFSEPCVTQARSCLPAFGCPDSPHSFSRLRVEESAVPFLVFNLTNELVENGS